MRQNSRKKHRSLAWQHRSLVWYLAGLVPPHLPTHQIEAVKKCATFLGAYPRKSLRSTCTQRRKSGATSAKVSGLIDQRISRFLLLSPGFLPHAPLVKPPTPCRARMLASWEALSRRKFAHHMLPLRGMRHLGLQPSTGRQLAAPQPPVSGTPESQRTTMGGERTASRRSMMLSTAFSVSPSTLTDILANPRAQIHLAREAPFVCTPS